VLGEGLEQREVGRTPEREMEGRWTFKI